MPPGAEVTEPDPVPARLTVNVNWFDTAGANFALQVVDRVFNVIVVLAVLPVQPPDQPAKMDPDAGEAVRVMTEYFA